MAVSIELFPFLDDNYGILLHDCATGTTACIDAIDKAPIVAALNKHNWTLTDIFVTHHHWDHTDGIMDLKSLYDVKVTGPAAEASKIKGLDIQVKNNDTISLGQTQMQVIATPGHTLGHVCYFDSENKNLFSGDALFSLGCGRMFEGAPEPMWEGLKLLRALPDDTNVYCGHEYSAGNAAFALSIDPDNPALKKRAEQITALRKTQRSTVPFNLGEDKNANPFLRADSPEMASSMNLTGARPAEVFASIRKAKDHF